MQKKKERFCVGGGGGVRSGASVLLTAEVPRDETPAGPEVQTGSVAVMIMMCLASVSVERRGCAPLLASLLLASPLLASPLLASPPPLMNLNSVHSELASVRVLTDRFKQQEGDKAVSLCSKVPQKLGRQEDAAEDRRTKN